MSAESSAKREGGRGGYFPISRLEGSRLSLICGSRAKRKLRRSKRTTEREEFIVTLISRARANSSRMAQWRGGGGGDINFRINPVRLSFVSREQTPATIFRVRCKSEILRGVRFLLVGPGSFLDAIKKITGAARWPMDKIVPTVEELVSSPLPSSNGRNPILVLFESTGFFGEEKRDPGSVR